MYLSGYYGVSWWKGILGLRSRTALELWQCDRLDYRNSPKSTYVQETKSGVKAEKSGYVWDKPADLAIIDKVCIDLNISFFETIAGTFWFYLPTKKGKTKCVTTDMDAFPTFEPVKKKEANAS